MSLPVFFESPRRSRAVPVLYLIKVCAAVFAFSLLTLASVAHAQGSGGRWVPVPCDANGDPPPSGVHFTDDYFPLYGTETWTTTSTYFPATTSAAQTASVFGGIGDEANTGNYPSSALAGNSDGLSPVKWWYSTENQYSSTPGQNGYINGTITVKMQGDLHAYYKLEWQSPSSSAPTSPRPDHIDLLLRTNLNAYVETDYFSSGLQSGLSGTATATDGLPFGETASAGAADGPVGGSHLVRAAVDPATGIAQVFVGGDLRWDATNLVRYGTMDNPVSGYPNYITGQRTYGETRAQASSGITARVRPDDREVAISSAIETSYFKSADEYSGSPIQAQHYRNPDGSIAVDSAVEWHSYLDTIEQPTGHAQGWQINKLPLTASASNFSFPNTAWSLSGLAKSQAWLQLSPDNPKFCAYFFLLEPDENQFPLHCTVRVDVTDTDTAVAANTYDITWHLPYETTDYIGQTKIGKTIDQTLVSGIYPSGDYDLQASKSEDIDLSAVLDAGEVISAALGREDIAGILKIAAALAKVGDAKIHYAGQDLRKGGRNDGSAWGVACQDHADAYGGGNVFPASEASDPSGWHDCQFSWCVVSKWREKSWHADKYTDHGYDSSGHVLTVHVTDMVDEEPYFKKYKNSDGTPFGG